MPDNCAAVKLHMRTILIFALVFTGSYYASGDPAKQPSPSDQVRDAEVIAFVSVSAVTSVTYTNPAGQITTDFCADGKVERVLKGKPPERIRLKDGSADSILPQHSRIPDARFLVFVKRSGDFYTTANKDDLAQVWGSIPGNRIVLWSSMCISDVQAVARVEKELKDLRWSPWFD